MTPDDVQARLVALQEADQLKARILNMAAHELNTPLTPLRLQTHVLLSGVQGPLTDSQRKSIEILDRNVTRLSSLVAEILDVARIQSDELKIKPRAVTALNLVEEAVANYEEAARRVGLELKTNVDPHLMLWADPERSMQVLFNLLSNALKFTPEGGRVVVQAVEKDGEALLCVDDSGAGMTDEQMQKLFAPFVQVHDVDKFPVRGTGLGLFISKGIVERQGGRMTVRSAGPGKGTSFCFTLPLVRHAQTAPAREPSATPLPLVHVTAKGGSPLARRLRELI